MKVFFAILIFLFGCSFKFEPVRFDHVDTGLFMLKVNTKRLKGEIKPYVAQTPATADEIYSELLPKAVINGGFFDMNTGMPISYVTLNGEVVDSPDLNLPFMQSIEGKEYKNNILNRTEFRVLDCKGKIKYDIARRNAPLANLSKERLTEARNAFALASNTPADGWGFLFLRQV